MLEILQTFDSDGTKAISADDRIAALFSPRISESTGSWTLVMNAQSGLIVRTVLSDGHYHSFLATI